MLQRNVARIRRNREQAKTKKRRHITRGLLLQMLATCDEDTLIDANLHAALCLAFASFTRIDESAYSTEDRDDPTFAK